MPMHCEPCLAMLVPAFWDRPMSPAALKVIGALENGVLQLDVDGVQVAIELANLDKARLVPTF